MNCVIPVFVSMDPAVTVSYTHLDVYKRQLYMMYDNLDTGGAVQFLLAVLKQYSFRGHREDYGEEAGRKH